MILETDMLRESRLKQAAARALQGLPVLVPRVFPQFGTSTILVTDLIEDQDFFQFLASSCQVGRDRIGVMLWRSLYVLLNLVRCRGGAGRSQNHLRNPGSPISRNVFFSETYVQEVYRAMAFVLAKNLSMPLGMEFIIRVFWSLFSMLAMLKAAIFVFVCTNDVTGSHRFRHVFSFARASKLDGGCRRRVLKPQVANMKYLG